MAEYTVDAGKVAAHNKTLTANTDDEVAFADNVSAVRVICTSVAAGSTAPIWVSGDGAAATVAGTHTYRLPAIADAELTIEMTSGVDEVHLISAGAHTYSVEKAL